MSANVCNKKGRDEISIPLLDHGYLKTVDAWGSDERVVEAARMSTDKGFLRWDAGTCPVCGGEGWLYADAEVNSKEECYGCGGKGQVAGDMKLLSYLLANKHETPFEMAGLTIEAQAPIFVFREWHRHRVPFGYNELSARYTPLPNFNYVPTKERVLLGGGHLTKQAGTVKGAAGLDEGGASTFRLELAAQYEEQERNYQRWLGMGVPKELARVGLPVGRYSRMRATGNLRGWLGFLTLRMHPTAQWEIRQYADAVGSVLREVFPRVWSLFVERTRERTAAGTALKLLRKLVEQHDDGAEPYLPSLVADAREILAQIGADTAHPFA